MTEDSKKDEVFIVIIAVKFDHHYELLDYMKTQVTFMNYCEEPI